MTARTALDPRDRLTRTAEKLKEHPWAQGMDLWLDGFTDFTPQQREVLRHLMRQADSLTVTLTCDHLEEDEGGAGIFSPARRTAAGLLRLAAQEGISCEVEHLVPDWDKRCEPLRQVEKQLFAHGEAEPVSCQRRADPPVRGGAGGRWDPPPAADPGPALPGHRGDGPGPVGLSAAGRGHLPPLSDPGVHLRHDGHPGQAHPHPGDGGAGHGGQRLPL